jgi:hypothetical protein
MTIHVAIIPADARILEVQAMQPEKFRIMHDLR